MCRVWWKLYRWSGAAAARWRFDFVAPAGVGDATHGGRRGVRVFRVVESHHGVVALIATGQRLDQVPLCRRPEVTPEPTSSLLVSSVLPDRLNTLSHTSVRKPWGPTYDLLFKSDPNCFLSCVWLLIWWKKIKFCQDDPGVPLLFQTAETFFLLHFNLEYNGFFF